MILVPAANTLSAFAPGSSGAATGTVTSTSGGAAIAGATVSDGGGASISTNGSGLYALGGLAPGIHQLTAAASGFASGTRTVSIVAGTTTSSVDFSLTPTASVPRFVQAAGAAETTASTSLTGTFATSTSTGHLLVLSASVYTGTTNRITSVSDSGGNTWTRIAAFYTAGHNSDGEMWYAANARPVTSVTVHTGAAALVALAVQEFSGVSTTLPPGGFAGTTKLSTSASSGSVTPTAANDVEVGFVAGHANSEPISVTAAGYSTQAQQTSTKSGSTSASLITGYKVLTSASPSTFSGNFPSAMYWAAGIVSFKAGP
jgi:Carboxypeptidase regulatory-like domain